MSISRGVPGKNNTVAQLHAIAASGGGIITRSTLRPACNPRRSGCPGRRLQE
ncbi:hypothetical protein IEO21_08853 [Rhodonia placenta]|uniref:Uncharacterized protein n=1 Tax=Rhodonia placenta TaxID=104341 RepID=A0A8H7NVG2_9APHY|nr:hypothetical protein IEO21_08853 [Postia placenta]